MPRFDTVLMTKVLEIRQAQSERSRVKKEGKLVSDKQGHKEKPGHIELDRLFLFLC